MIFPFAFHEIIKTIHVRRGHKVFSDKIIFEEDMIREVGVLKG